MCVFFLLLKLFASASSSVISICFFNMRGAVNTLLRFFSLYFSPDAVVGTPTRPCTNKSRQINVLSKEFSGTRMFFFRIFDLKECSFEWVFLWFLIDLLEFLKYFFRGFVFMFFLVLLLLR